MNRFWIILFLFVSRHSQAQKPDFSSYPVYKGTDLGLTYTPTQSSFRIWAPSANEAKLLLFDKGVESTSIMEVDMKKDISGTWTAKLAGNQKGKYYVFKVKVNDKWMNEVPDP